MTLIERPATRADLAGVLALCLTFDVAVRGFPDSDESDILADWDVPGFDLGACTRLLEDDGQVVGYAVVSGSETDSVVRPSHTGQGLEARLIRWIETAADPGTTVTHSVPVVLPDLAAAFDSCGWRPTRTFWRMRIDHLSEPPPAQWPAGVGVRAFDVDRDARVAHQIVQVAFADIGGQHERSWQEWSVAMLDSKRYDPELYLVAEDSEAEDGVVGVLLSQDLSGDYGFVRQLAVPRAHRGRGLGRALLLEAFARHAARGLPQTQLGVDAANQTGATRLYESVGMRVSEEFTSWEKQV